jgi:hypothetical protein
MMNFSLKLRTNTFEQGHLVFGPIWIELDSQAFPGREWGDFPVVILGWWLQEIRALVTSQSTICECSFMDGPYKFLINPLRKKEWHITCIKETINEKGEDVENSILETALSPKNYVSELLKAADDVVKVCNQNNWKSKDLMNLEQELRERQSILRSL